MQLDSDDVKHPSTDSILRSSVHEDSSVSGAILLLFFYLFTYGMLIESS